jgi:excisionase family DNA binding protein
MVDTHPEVMTIHEVSEYLRIPISSLYRLAQSGKIPCQKVGRHWRFRREAIDRWLEENPFRNNPQKIILSEKENA